MYESPIEKICSEIQTQIAKEDENMILNAVRTVGVNVNKEELIKALQYDRNQYKKGYEDGKTDVLEKIRAEIEELSTSKCTETCRIYIDAVDFKENVLAIIDKYKEESEE